MIEYVAVVVWRIREYLGYWAQGLSLFKHSWGFKAFVERFLYDRGEGFGSGCLGLGGCKIIRCCDV